MRKTLFAVAAAAALIGPAALPAAATPAPVARVTMAGSTVLTGSSSGSLAVRLPRPTTFAVTSGTDSGFEAAGGGSFIGFVLAAETRASDRVVISGSRVTNGTGGHVNVAMSHTSALSNGAEQWTLPAGNYRLHLVTNGRRASVRMALPGLRGQARLTPSRRTSLAIMTPDARYLPQGQQTGGALGRLHGAGILLAITTSVHPFSPAQAHLDCIYVGDNAATALHAPGCPDADVRLADAFTNPNIERTANLRAAATFSATGGPFAQGYSFTNIGFNERLQYTAVWLTL